MKGRKQYSEEAQNILAFRKYFGDNLRRIRVQLNCSQEAFAELCGIERAYYGRIERGECSPTIDCCYLIASSLELEVFRLFEDLPE